MNFDIPSILSKTDLGLAPEAIAAISDGWQVEVSPQLVKCSELHRIYAIRLQHLASIANDHSNRLTDATGVFVNNLASNITLSGHWASVHNGEPGAFHIFVLPESHQALCCIYLVDKRGICDSNRQI